MADEFFWINVLFAFCVGVIWIAVITLMADRFGSKVGGFVGGLPSTVVVSFFFIGLSQTPHIASEATTVFPLVFSVNGLFTVSYVIISKRSFAAALIFSLHIWLILSGIIIIFKIEDFILSLLIYVLILFFSYYILEEYLKITSPDVDRVTNRFTPYQIIFRSLFGGSIIAFAVFMSKIAGPIFGGIFSAFPALFISSLIISFKSWGIEFSRSLAKSFMITSMITVVGYVIAVRYFYPIFGLNMGTILAFIISMIGAYFTLNFIRKRLR